MSKQKYNLPVPVNLSDFCHLFWKISQCQNAEKEADIDLSPNISFQMSPEAFAWIISVSQVKTDFKDFENMKTLMFEKKLKIGRGVLLNLTRMTCICFQPTTEWLIRKRKWLPMPEHRNLKKFRRVPASAPSRQSTAAIMKWWHQVSYCLKVKNLAGIYNVFDS